MRPKAPLARSLSNDSAGQRSSKWSGRLQRARSVPAETSATGQMPRCVNHGDRAQHAAIYDDAHLSNGQRSSYRTQEVDREAGLYTAVAHRAAEIVLRRPSQHALERNEHLHEDHQRIDCHARCRMNGAPARVQLIINHGDSRRKTDANKQRSSFMKRLRRG